MARVNLITQMMSGIHVVVAHLILEERYRALRGAVSGAEPRESCGGERSRAYYFWRNLLSGLHRFDQQGAQRLREGAELLTQSFR